MILIFKFHSCKNIFSNISWSKYDLLDQIRSFHNFFNRVNNKIKKKFIIIGFLSYLIFQVLKNNISRFECVDKLKLALFMWINWYKESVLSQNKKHCVNIILFVQSEINISEVCDFV